MKPGDLARLLLHKADHDLVVVAKWGSDPDIADEIVGFHAQQAAEKTLKAVLAHERAEFPFTHRLADLIDLIQDQGIAFPDELDEVRFLTPFAVELRYGVCDVGDVPMERDETLRLLGELRTWARRLIGL